MNKREKEREKTKENKGGEAMEEYRKRGKK